MIFRRFFAVLMEPSVSEQIRIRGEISGDQLQAKAVLQKKAGWKDACEDQEQEENMMTNLPDPPEEGKQYVCAAPVMTEGKTKAPGRYTEGTLIDQMAVSYTHLTLPTIA